MSVFSTRCLVILALAAAGTLAPLDAAFATNFYVSMGGKDTNACTTSEAPCRTIQAAVNKAADGDWVMVEPGTYAEAVAINGRNSLSIFGSTGTILEPPASPQPWSSHIINLWNSRNIRLSDLVLQGKGVNDSFGGLSMNESQAVGLARLTVQDMGGGGIVLFRNSSASLRASTIRRNSYNGLRVDAGSSLQVGSSDPSETVFVEDNPFQGIAVYGVLSLRGNVVIQRNAYGVMSNGGSLDSCCSGEGTVRVVDNEAHGFRMQGGHFALRGPAVIEGNKLGGIRLIVATAFLNQWGGNAIIVRNNGASAAPETGAGIMMTGSHLEGSSLEVSGNGARGILLQDASSMRIWNVTITGNAAEGVYAEGHSVARILAPATVNGNAFADVACSRNSSGAGDVSGIGRLLCADFEKIK